MQHKQFKKYNEMEEQLKAKLVPIDRAFEQGRYGLHMLKFCINRLHKEVDQLDKRSTSLINLETKKHL